MGYKHQEECCFPEPIEFCIPEKIRCVRCEPKLVWICKEEEFCLRECPKPKCECSCRKSCKRRCEHEDWCQDEPWEMGSWCQDERGEDPCAWRVGGCF